jgi:hypothetical protein
MNLWLNEVSGKRLQSERNNKNPGEVKFTQMLKSKQGSLNLDEEQKVYHFFQVHEQQIFRNLNNVLVFQGGMSKSTR